MKMIFDKLRELCGGRLTQKQVDAADQLIATASDTVADMLGVTVDLVKQISAEGIILICSFEGLELKAYLDSANIWTIGYGTIIRNGVKVKKGDTCTIEQAKAYMASDLKSFESAVNKVKVPLNQNQYDALVSLAYNIGVNAFANSTLLKKLNAQDYKGAAAQFDVWNKVKGKVVQGLVNRRAKERKLFEKAI